MGDEMGTTVELYVYDLSKGVATSMSEIMLGELQQATS